MSVKATIKMLDRIGVEMMNHSEALQQMAAERYLLDELTPDAREAFEEHLFDCPECALDLRAGAAFVEAAKTQLPELTGALVASASPARTRPSGSGGFSGFGRPLPRPRSPALLLVLGYQNLVTYPRLRAAASQPRLIPWAQLRGDMRGAPVYHNRRPRARSCASHRSSLAAQRRRIRLLLHRPL